MMTTTAVLNELLEPVGRLLTPEIAKELVDLRASPSVQARIDQLAAKSSEGTLTAGERAEYETYAAVGIFIAILQSKARKLLRGRPPG
jgi:hypothetical protein